MRSSSAVALNQYNRKSIPFSYQPLKTLHERVRVRGKMDAIECRKNLATMLNPRTA